MIMGLGREISMYAKRYYRTVKFNDRLIVTHKEIGRHDILIAASSKEKCQMDCVILACCVKSRCKDLPMSFHGA